MNTYIDLLDSMNTAHVDNEEWWRPKNPSYQEQGVAIAKSAVIMKILFGETIVTVRNQVFDSYAWFKIFREFANLNYQQLPYKPFVWSAYGYGQNPLADDFIKDAIKVFTPSDLPNQFMLSAWPNLSPQQRKTIADNIGNNQRFENMLNKTGIKDPVFQEQAYALQYFYDYLHQRTDKNLVIPSNSVSVNKNIWNKLNEVANKQNGISEEYLQYLDAQARSQAMLKTSIPEEIEKTKKAILETRSALYSFITPLAPAERSILRKFVDGFYNIKNCYSSTNGVGCYSVFDQDISIPLSDDGRILEVIDSTENAERLSSHSLISYLPDKLKEFDNLNLNDCIPLIQDHDFLESCNAIHQLIDEYNLLPINTITRVVKVNDWNKRVNEAIDKHLEFLGHALKNKIIRHKNIYGFITGAAPVIGTAAGGVIGLITPDKVISFLDPTFLPVITSTLGSTLGVLLRKILESETTAVSLTKFGLHKFIKKDVDKRK